MPQMPHVSTLQRRLAWNTSAQLVGRAVSAGTTLLLTIIIARRFGADGFGDFVKITTFLSFFYLMADFGLNAVYLQKDEDNAWEHLLMLRILLGSILVGAATIILWLLPHGNDQGYTGVVRMGILLFAPNIVFQALITTSNALFQKYLRYDLSTIAISAGSLISLALVVFVARGTAVRVNVLSVTTAILIGSAVAAGISLVLTRRLEAVRHSNVSLASLWSLFVASIPLGLTLVFNLIYFRMDSVILTLTRSTTEVGIYGLAYKIFELPLVIPTFFMNALYPVMLKATRGKGSETKNTFRRLIVRSGVLLLLVSCGMMLFLWLVAPVVALVRSDFGSGVQVLRVLALGLPLFFLSSLTMWTFIAKRKHRELAFIYGLSMILNVGLNILFVPAYGYMAAAWITVVSEGFVLVVSAAVGRRLFTSETL